MISGDDRASAVLIAMAGLALHLAVAAWSPGYDDEFANMSIVTRYATMGEMISFVNSNDVHPPGQYVLNRLLYTALGDWWLVRATTAMIGYICLVHFLHTLGFFSVHRSPWQLTCIVAHPTMLMWGTSLRWYGYFTPLLLVAVTLLLNRSIRASILWPLLFALCTAMFYVCYLSVVICPILIVAAAIRRQNTLRSEWPIIVASGALAAACAWPQVKLFLTSHLRNGDEQSSGMIKSVAGAAMGLFTNAGFFPLAPAAVVGALATLVLLVRVCTARAINGNLKWIAGIVAITCALMIAAGITGKPRNLEPLVPLFMTAVVTGMPRLTSDPRGRIAAWTLAAVTLMGAANVAAHIDTVKGSWNLPLRGIVELLHDLRREETGPMTVACFDPGVAFYAREIPDVSIIGPNGCGTDPVPIVPPGTRLAVVLTFRGALSQSHYQRMLSELPSDPDQTVHLGRDSNAAIKKLFDPDAPAWYATILFFPPRKSPLALPSWGSNSPAAARE